MKRKRIRLDRKIKFTNKKQSKIGMLSVLIAIAALYLFWRSFLLAFTAKGNAGFEVGVLGVGAFLTALLGFITGMLSLKNKNVFYTFSWIGIIVNFLVWFLILLIFLIGV